MTGWLHWKNEKTGATNWYYFDDSHNLVRNQWKRTLPDEHKEYYFDEAGKKTDVRNA
ncbi:hypothetical protein HFP67_31760 [Bacillus sp. CB102A.1]